MATYTINFTKQVVPQILQEEIQASYTVNDMSIVGDVNSDVETKTFVIDTNAENQSDIETIITSHNYTTALLTMISRLKEPNSNLSKMNQAVIKALVQEIRKIHAEFPALNDFLAIIKELY